MPAGLARQPGMLESPVPNKMYMATQHAPSKLSSLWLAQPLSAAPADIVKMWKAVPGLDKADGSGNCITKSIYDTLGWDDDGHEELA